VTSAQIQTNPIPLPFLPPLFLDTLPEDEQEKLVLSHMDEVRQVARSIVRRLPVSVQLDDLVQAGSIGLIDAARRYGPSRNLPFRQYARIRITGAIIDSLRELDWASRYFRTRQHKLDNATHTLESKLGRKPQSEEIADSLGMDLNSFYELAQAVQNRQEVDFEPREDSECRSVQESVADNPERRPDCVCHQNQSREVLRKLIAELPTDEANVIILYYFKDWTMARIARSIGKTESRVSQIHGKAMGHLRLRLGHRGHELMNRLL